MPFNMYDRNGDSWSIFTNLELLINCASLARTLGLGPCTVFDRHGAPLDMKDETLFKKSSCKL
jgi:hypothetical protein